MRSTVCSAPDPYTLPSSYRLFGDPKSGTGYTLVDPRLVVGEDTLIGLIIGQSNASNWSTSAHTVVQAKNHMGNLWDGGVYTSAHPVVGGDMGSGGKCYLLHAADELIGDGDTERTIFWNIALGGRLIGEFEGTAAVNNTTIFDLRDRITVAARRMAYHGHTPDFVLFQIGEADGIAGTSQAAFEASGAAVNTRINSIWPGVPQLWSQSTRVSGSNNATIRAAITTLQGQQEAGPDFDAVTNRSDGTHFDATGFTGAATALQTSLVSVLGL